MNITEICFLQHKESTKDFRTFLSNLHFIFTSFRLLDVLISQGIDHLDFRPDKFGNQDIVGMVSAEEEVRPYLQYYLYFLYIHDIIYHSGGGILQHHLPGGCQGNGGEMAAAGREANDQVTEGHNRKGIQKIFWIFEYLMFNFWLIFSGNDRILQHRPFNMGAGLAWAGTYHLIFNLWCKIFIII